MTEKEKIIVVNLIRDLMDRKISQIELINKLCDMVK